MNMSFKLFDLCNVFIYFLSTTDDVLILNSFAILFVISDAFILSLRATVFKLVNAAGHDSLLAEVVLVPPIETHSISGSARLKSQTISRWENWRTCIICIWLILLPPLHLSRKETMLGKYL